MELLLNLLWLTISIGLGVLLFVSRIRREAPSGNLIHSNAAAWVSYLLLIALLLPAISMTDDLMAMVAPTDGEQVVRRYEVSAAGQYHAIPHITYFHAAREVFCAAPACVGAAEAVPDLRVAIASFRNPAHGRAPPVVA